MLEALTLRVGCKGGEIARCIELGNQHAILLRVESNALLFTLKISVVKRLWDTALRLSDVVSLAVWRVEPVDTSGPLSAATLPALGAGPKDLEAEVLAVSVCVALTLRAGREVVEEGRIAVLFGVPAITDGAVVAEVEVGT